MVPQQVTASAVALSIHRQASKRKNPRSNGPGNFSDQIETVEIWEKLDERNVEVDVWIYDPPALLEPWYTREVYAKLNDPEKSLRIRYWDCNENQNNATFVTEEGGTDFTDFTFTTEDDR